MLILLILSAVFILYITVFMFILMYYEGANVNIQELWLHLSLTSFVFIGIIVYFRKITFFYFTMLSGNQHFSKNEFTEAYIPYSKIYALLDSKVYRLILPLSQEILTTYYISFSRTNSEIGRKKEAIHVLEMALKTVQKRGSNSQLWQVYYEFGNLYQSENELEKAYSSYHKAIEIIEEIRDHVQVSERREQFFDNKVEVYSSIVLVSLKLDMEEKAFEYAEKAKSRVFLDMLSSEKVKIKTNLELKEKEKDLLQQIQNIELKLKSRRGYCELNEKLNELFEDYDKLLLQIKDEDPDYYSLKKSHVLNIYEIQKHLDENEVLLEFFVGDVCMGFLITSNTFDTINFSVDKAFLLQYVQLFRKQIGLRGDITDIAKILYDYFIKDIEPFIEGKNLIIVPHGILHYLPFNALYDGNKWLIEKYNVRFLQSASIIQYLNYPPKNLMSALVVGDPTGELESAKLEAIKIAKKFQTSPLSGSDATKDAIVNNIKNKDVLHFACHGIFESEAPKFSRLALADGNLYVNDIYNLDVDANLVTLSACQTALGSFTNGDEVEGMTRAFMRAGSPSVISSLWNVDDKSTEMLFSKFYELDGNKVERLRNSQLQLMQKYEHPFYWAPFILFGDK